MFDLVFFIELEVICLQNQSKSFCDYCNSVLNLERGIGKREVFAEIFTGKRDAHHTLFYKISDRNDCQKCNVAALFK